MSCSHFNDIDVTTLIGTIETISFGNFATTQIIMNKNIFYLFQNNTNKDYMPIFLNKNDIYLL